MRVEINNNIIESALSDTLKKEINFNIKGVSIDSRNFKKGDLFIALKGEKCHGADFINSNLIDKAAHIISDIKIDSDKSTLVDDSRRFLTDFASCFRGKIKTKIIGITGSNGKTSTKELLKDFLKTKYDISHSKANYNTTVSLPLSLLACNTNSDYCVLEMGASKTGEIGILSEICKPDFGLITNISEAHIAGYKDFNDLVKTKLALFESVSNSNGMLFLNKDDLHITNNYDKKSNKIISYSLNDVNSDFVGDLSEINQGIVSINNNLFNVPYRTNVFAFNFLASYSIASTFGVDSASIQNTLDQFELPEGRGDYLNINSNTIINDSYNANLESMVFGIAQLKSMKNAEYKIILILGDMLELGDRSEYNHKKLGKYINGLNFIDCICGYGDLISDTLDCINNSKIIKKYFRKKDLLEEYLKSYVSKNDILYLKGSRSLSLETIIDKVFKV